MIHGSAHLTLPHVAQVLGVPYRTAYELLLTGELRGTKVAGQWHIERESLRQLLQRRGVVATRIVDERD